MYKHRYSTPYQDPRWRRVIRPRILARDNGICQIRGVRCQGTATTVDHIIPIALDGPWFDEANLRAACTPCNSGRFLTKAVDTTPASAPSRDW